MKEKHLNESFDKKLCGKAWSFRCIKANILPIIILQGGIKWIRILKSIT